MLFGQKKPEGKTVLLLDVEQGSVGGALVRLTAGEAPRLFGETREFLPVAPTRDSSSLMRGIAGATHSVLGKVAEVAARLRNHPKAGPAGRVESATVFLAAPWGTPDLAGTPVFVGAVQDTAANAIEHLFGVPAAFHTAAGAALGGARQLLPHNDPYLLCMVGGEVSELLLVAGGAATAYGTAPLGRHSALRTLRTHGGLSEEEARSLLRLGHTPHEASRQAASHFADGLSDTARDLLAQAPANKIYIVAHESGEWFARALSAHEGMSGLFPQGGVVRALGPAHVRSQLYARGSEPDPMLGLQALFTNDTLQW